MKAHKFSILSLAFFMLASVAGQAAQLASAKVVDVIGTVTKYSAGGEQSPLQKGDILKEGDSVSVTALSRADLVFSNGSELTIEENTSVNIAKLQQEAFAGNKTYGQLQADPSKSQTLLELNYGKLNGHVKKLRADSRFDIETPLGTAAIRGTNWSALLIYNTERQEFLFSVKNFDGDVEVISRYLGTIEYGEGNIGDKGYDASIDEETREVIPEDHTVILRLRKGQPGFDELFDLIENTDPTKTQPVITPGPVPGSSDPEDDDFGMIVSSPEGLED